MAMVSLCHDFWKANGLRLIVLVTISAVSSSSLSAQPSGGQVDVQLSVLDKVLDGMDPNIKLSGLPPNQEVRVHVLRSLEKWQQVGDQWQRKRQPLHAYGDFISTPNGTVDVQLQAPLRGTYKSVDSLALLRSGYRFGDPKLQGVRVFSEEPLNAAPSSQVWIKAELGNRIVAEKSLELLTEAEGIAVGQRKGDGWHAVYARPADGKQLPVVISLHGSEGGSIEKARARALSFASRGFATVAVNYFAYAHEAIEGIPTEHSEIKVEILQSVRDWLKERPEVDVERISLVGVSKGAEFALVAASKFAWIHSVVAIVPSDVVWEGYAEGGGAGTAASSWSWEGKPLAFIPLFPFDPKQEGLYRTNTERYERSRRYHLDKIDAARIPVETASARILLLASDRDEVWASGDMARNIVERFVASKKANQIEVRIYPKAGHQISGTGTFPVRLYGEPSDDRDAKDLDAEGDAAADAWKRTLAFLSPQARSPQ